MGRFKAIRARWERQLQAERPPHAHPLGWRCFQLGLLLLASSALLGSLLLLLALVLGSRGREPFWRDRANRLLVLAAGLMVLGCFTASSGWLAWVGLGNWLPFFWAFWGFQPYVATAAARRKVALWLVAGTVPVVLTGLGQLWWGWGGPFQALQGLVVWWIEPGVTRRAGFQACSTTPTSPGHGWPWPGPWPWRPCWSGAWAGGCGASLCCWCWARRWRST